MVQKCSKLRFLFHRSELYEFELNRVVLLCLFFMGRMVKMNDNK